MSTAPDKPNTAKIANPILSLQKMGRIFMWDCPAAVPDGFEYGQRGIGEFSCATRRLPGVKGNRYSN